MRLQLIGSYSIEELQAAFASIVKDLEEKRIETVRSVNVYLQPCANGKEIRFYEAEREIDHMIYDFDKTQKIEVVSKNK